MSLYQKAKSIWKKYGKKGKIKNFSSKKLWILEVENGIAIARILPPGFKSPPKVDVDAFKRLDGIAIDEHKNWWKFYDFSTAEIFDHGKSVKVSIITKVAVDEKHFGISKYKKQKWGLPIQVITDVRRDRNSRINAYYISNLGWVNFEQALKMTCHHEIDNARPVFPKDGRPYIRTRRDKYFFNNLSSKGKT